MVTPGVSSAAVAMRMNPTASLSFLSFILDTLFSIGLVVTPGVSSAAVAMRMNPTASLSFLAM